MLPPQTNATLTKVERKSGSENFLNAEAAPTVKWQGTSPCWVDEAEATQATGGGETQRRRDTVQFDATLCALEPEDELTFTLGSSSEVRRKVQNITTNRLDGKALTYTARLFDA